MRSSPITSPPFRNTLVFLAKMPDQGLAGLFLQAQSIVLLVKNDHCPGRGPHPPRPSDQKDELPSALLTSHPSKLSALCVWSSSGLLGQAQPPSRERLGRQMPSKDGAKQDRAPK